jgi:outer membrane lipoprotein carrier protein
MLKLKVCLLGLVLFFSAHAQPNSDASEELYALIQGFESLSGKFEQTLQDHEGVALQETSGQFFLQRPGNIYWHSDEPFEQLVISNSQLTWVYDPDLEQVSIYANSEMQDGPMQVLAGSLETLQGNYDVEKSEKGKQQAFILKPKLSAQIEQGFESLSFVFRKKKLVGIEMKDKLQQLTLLDFKSLKQNPKIPASRFQFDIPEGVDVIENGAY